MDVARTLCAVCREIDFSQYFQCAINSEVFPTGFVGPTKEALKLGSLLDLIERSTNCGFCRLVGKNVRTRLALQNYAARRDEKDVECWIYSYRFAINKPSDANSETAYRIGIATRLERTVPSEIHIADIQLLAEDAIHLGDSKMFYGRILNPNGIDIELARDWLQQCELQHGKLCQLPGPIQRPMELLVIDVKRLCICSLPADARYVALSYCWPLIKPFTLTEAVRAELSEPQSLKYRLQEIPQAIRDAICCTSDLGESYLWVDSLCIIQDSEDNKQSQISQMDRIYSSAFVTLVAAAEPQLDRGRTDRGLHGYRKNIQCRQHEVETVQGLRLMATLPHILSALNLSRWSFRSWTLQERLLSPRLLCFTDFQVYFQCTCSIFCEDSLGEGRHPSAYITPATNLFHLGSPHASRGVETNLGTSILQRTPYPDWVWNLEFGDYASVVEDYTWRSLSYDSDILNAFGGIESIMKQSMKTDFWYGLPEARLTSALLWITDGKERRRVSIHGYPDKYFPSWTWAGWTKPANYSSYFNNTRPLRREIEWFLINRKGEALWMKTRDLPKEELSSFDEDSHQKAIPAGYDTKPPPHGRVVRKIDLDLMHVDWRYPQYLACWTTVATLCLSGKVVPLENAHRMAHLAITNLTGLWIGSVMMPQDWVSDQLNSSRNFEFMLISRNRSLNKREITYRYFDEDVFAYRQWSTFHVMMIERRDEVASRLGVGIVHEDAWANADPQAMFVKLE